MKLDILAVGVHPDDVELSCSGTLLKQIDFGSKVGILDLTKGELGSRGSAELRMIEAKKASEIMGLHARESLDMPDGFFDINQENRLSIIKVIRKYRPDIVLANVPTDRHTDHGRAAKLVLEACFLSGLLKIETEENGKAQQHWRPKSVYHYIQDFFHHPDFVIDISDYLEKKMEVILAYSSQFYNPQEKSPKTPISGKDFLEFLKSRAIEFGRPAGYQYAEGFLTTRTPGLKNLLDLQ